MSKPRSEHKDNFQKRWLKIDPYIPSGYEKEVLNKYPDKKISTIQNTRYGRTFDFEVLEILEKLVENSSK